MKIAMGLTARANLDTYRGDPPLHQAMDQALTAIKYGLPASRQNAITSAGGRAWWILVLVPGRDQEYQIVWVETPQGTAAIVHLGLMIT